MDKPQTLTPEVVAILSEIREQAHKYNLAFENFEELLRKSEALQVQSDRHLAKLERETLRLASEFQKLTEESTSKIDAKIISIDYIFNELDTIQKIKHSLETLEATFKKNTATLSVVVENIKTLVVRQVEKEAEHLSRKINASNDESKESFSVVNQKIEEMQVQQRRDFVMLDEEIGSFKGKVQETKYIVDETVKLVNILVEKAEKELYNKFNEAKQNMATIMGQLEKSAKQSEEVVAKLMREADVTNLSMRVIALTNHTNEMQAKVTYSFWIAVISLIIAVCLIGVIAAISL